jgi:mRNA deadenylase 3'-5' endonuclease subunit Ccr4
MHGACILSTLFHSLMVSFFSPQEVDAKVYERYLSPLMKRRGFDGWYANKAGKVTEGSVLFFRVSLFELVAKCGPLALYCSVYVVCAFLYRMHCSRFVVPPCPISSMHVVHEETHTSVIHVA